MLLFPPPRFVIFSLLLLFLISIVFPFPPHFDCFDRVDVGSMWGRCRVDVGSLLFFLLLLISIFSVRLFLLLPIFIVLLLAPPPPPHFYFFPRKGQRGQNQAYKDKLKCDGLILASLAFSREKIEMRRRRRRENNKNEEEEEGKQ